MVLCVDLTFKEAEAWLSSYCGVIGYIQEAEENRMDHSGVWGWGTAASHLLVANLIMTTCPNKGIE